MLVIAPTAGGKSEAALIPVMDDILKHGRSGIACLYLSPLKALINDQEERFAAFCTPTSLTVTKWHGDVPKGDRSWKEGEPPHFLMITPESLEVLLQERQGRSGNVRAIIIDELHAFVETDRGVQIKVLLDRMDGITGRKVQRIGLSATTGNPEEVLAWLSDGRGSGAGCRPRTAKREAVQFLNRARGTETDRCARGDCSGEKSLVFVNSRSVAEHLAQALKGRVRNLHIHHSSLSPSTRKSAEDAFLSMPGPASSARARLNWESISGISTWWCRSDPGLGLVVPPADGAEREAWRGRACCMDTQRSLRAALQRCDHRMCHGAGGRGPLAPEQPWNVLLQQVFLYLHSTVRAAGEN